MPALSLLTLPLLVGMGQVRGTYEAQLRTEARARSVVVGDMASGSASGDLELVPSGRLGLDGGALQGSLWYSPRLVIREPQEAARSQFLHRARLLVEHGAGRRLRVWAAQDVGYGTTDLSLLTAPSGTNPGAGGTSAETPTDGSASSSPSTPSPRLPTLFAVRYLESETQVGTEGRLASNLSLTTGLSWLVSGGATDEARRTLPLQRGPTVRGSLEYRASARDTLRTTASAGHAWFSSGQRATLLTGVQEASRRIGPRTVGAASGGVGVSVFRAQGLPSSQRLYPTGSASLSHEVPLRAQTLSGSVAAVVAPTVDRFTGSILQRLEGSAALGARMNFGLTAGARMSQARSLPSGGAAADFATVAELFAGYPLAPHWTVDGGWRKVWQRLGVLGAGTDQNWLGFVAVTFTDSGGL